MFDVLFTETAYITRSGEPAFAAIQAPEARHVYSIRPFVPQNFIPQISLIEIHKSAFITIWEQNSLQKSIVHDVCPKHTVGPRHETNP